MIVLVQVKGRPYIQDMSDATKNETRFQVVNIRTGEVVGTYGSRKRASTARDKKDNAYGGYAHTVREVKG